MEDKYNIMNVKKSFSLNKYDWIGFDLDHCIARYKLEALNDLIIQEILKFLVYFKGYPSVITNTELWSVNVCKGLFYDVRNGNILQISSDCKVIKAVNGADMLDSNQLNLYLSDYFELYSISETLKDTKHFKSFKDYFDYQCPFLLSNIVNTFKKLKIEIDYNIVYEDILCALKYMYSPENFEHNVGGFFPAVKQNPELYFYKVTSSFKKWLKKLNSVKYTFLLTSSHADYADYVAKFVLGESWKNYFHIIICNSKKPLFFEHSQPFYVVTDTFQESDLIEPYNMKSNSVYSQGNSKDLNKFFEHFSRLINPRVVYFGDNHNYDVFAPSKYSNWSAVAVVEEILNENQSNNLLPNFWLPYFTHSLHNDCIHCTLWCHIINKHSKLIIPVLESMTNICSL